MKVSPQMHQDHQFSALPLGLTFHLVTIFCVCLFLASTVLPLSRAKGDDSVTYTMQVENFNAQATQNTGSNGPYAGTYDNNSAEIGQYANNGSTGDTPGAAIFENFTTTGVSSTGTQRGLQVGDTFTVTNYIGSNPSSGGAIGIAFRTSTDNASYSAASTNVAEKFTLYDSGGYQAVGANANISTLMPATDTTLTIKITSSSTYNATITQVGGGSVTYYDQQLGNNPTATTQIQSFAIYSLGDNNGNSYWKNGLLTSTGTVELGAGNGTSTIGTITDGLAAASSTTTKANSVTKSGTGVITLANVNTYTGTTSVNAGTLLVNGSTSSSSAVTVASGATLGGTGDGWRHDRT